MCCSWEEGKSRQPGGIPSPLFTKSSVSRILEWDEDNLPILEVGGRKEPVEKSDLEAWARGRAEARGRCLESGLGICQAPMQSA